MYENRLLFVIATAHPDRLWREEALDLILTHDAFDYPISLLFIGQGIAHLKKDPEGFDLSALDLIDFEHLWFTTEESDRSQIECDPCLSKVEYLPAREIGAQLQAFTSVMHL
jgi:sulfur relay (sulfurtransferase) DsrF/TusC family protein